MEERMEKPRMTIILLHGGVDHIESQEILTYLEIREIIGLTKIYIGSEKTKQRILNNSYDVKIDHFPCIVFKKEDRSPEICPATIKNIKSLSKKLNNLRK